MPHTLCMPLLTASLILVAGSLIGVEATSPHTLADLKKVQTSVQDLLPKVRPAVVAIQTHDGTASGVIISEDGLILTAAHVAEKPGREMRVVLDDGKVVRATTLGLDKTTDAALMQMQDRKRQWPSVKVSREVIKAQPGLWCIALGHPGGFDKERGIVMRVGKVIKQTANSLQTDCVLMGGDSGGPLLNLAGEVIGIHSQIWEERDQNMHVSMAPFFRSWDDMKKSQVIRIWGTGSGGYLGLHVDASESGRVAVQEVSADSAAAKSGLLIGDIIEQLDDDTIHSASQFQNAIRLRPAGTQIELQIKRSETALKLKITLGSLPKEDAG